MKGQKMNGSWTWLGGLAALTMGILSLANGALAAERDSSNKCQCNPRSPCAQTAQAMLTEATASVASDYSLDIAKCLNLTSPAARAACLKQAKEDRKAGLQLTGDQFEARMAVCEALGGGAYDPVIKPEDFVAGVNNPYYTLTPGKTFVYEKISGTETERVEVEVTSGTKVIMGVTCMVVTDTATVNSEVVEDTIDWYAQDKAGNVWYFGELSKQYQNGELVSLEGSWQAGVDGAKPGIVMKAHPAVGDTYRQEFALGVAEDMSEVLGLNESATVRYGNGNTFNDCVKTKDFTPIKPDAMENKFFSATVGQVVLTVDTTTGDREELVQVIRP
jgi:hypothetical protein